jgi:hypothetical protein
VPYNLTAVNETSNKPVEPDFFGGEAAFHKIAQRFYSA